MRIYTINRTDPQRQLGHILQLVQLYPNRQIYLYLLFQILLALLSTASLLTQIKDRFSFIEINEAQSHSTFGLWPIIFLSMLNKICHHILPKTTVLSALGHMVLRWHFQLRVHKQFSFDAPKNSLAATSSCIIFLNKASLLIGVTAFFVFSCFFNFFCIFVFKLSLYILLPLRKMYQFYTLFKVPVVRTYIPLLFFILYG